VSSDVKRLATDDCEAMAAIDDRRALWSAKTFDRDESAMLAAETSDVSLSFTRVKSSKFDVIDVIDRTCDNMPEVAPKSSRSRLN
jgi:hypothetical protein